MQQRGGPNGCGWFLIIVLVIGTPFWLWDTLTGHPAGSSSATPAPVTTVAPPTPVVTAAPWPEAFGTLTCDALSQIVQTTSHLSELSNAAGAMDFATITSESKAIADLMKTAQSDLTAAPVWTPAVPLLKQLTPAVANLRKAANEYQLGVSSANATLINDGTTLIGRATGQINQATVELAKIRDKYGFGCP
jgi:hypothetical protein